MATTIKIAPPNILDELKKDFIHPKFQEIENNKPPKVYYFYDGFWFFSLADLREYLASK